MAEIIDRFSILELNKRQDKGLPLGLIRIFFFMMELG